ncbi:hypothetical protein V498_08127 [Pseudogymnoascus sp. VKM F-4517 (FW-2822)]|nr:hypothetical protein V498_08127 [Pseudogymnoascus sp. VKM F-4517 (FW-2822)]
MANIKLLVAFALFHLSACQLNMIWIGTAYPECNSCLDQTFLSCPGSYDSVGYAECMCKGNGGANLAACIPICDAADTLGTLSGSLGAVRGYYLYCSMFYKEICPDAKEYLDSEMWEERCGPDSGPLLGDSTEPSAISSTLEAGETTSATATTNALATSDPKGTAASTEDATSRPTSAAALVSNSLPRWSFMIGLAIQLVNMNL